MDNHLREETPIYLQIAERIEDGILSGAFKEGEQIPSITEFSLQLAINPATALKGITLLVQEEILFKKRGVGMFVAEGAVEQLRKKRKDAFFDQYIGKLIDEAKQLGISEEEILQMLKRGWNK